MHQGHFDGTMMAKKLNDKCYLIVCGYENEPRANELKLSYETRLCLVKEFYKDDEIIKVFGLNDTQLNLDQSMSESNWIIWVNAALDNIKKDLGITSFNDDDVITFYVAEEKYKERIDAIAHTFDVVIKSVLLPKEINVSATKIRQNPLKYWHLIVKPFRRYLSKNILVIGTASEGKTTLVRDIARYFEIPHVEEYGRTYMAERNMQDTDLRYHDMMEFLIHQRDELLKAENSLANNKGVIISDTDNLITLMYACAYADDENIPLTREDAENLKALVKNHLKRGVHWDKIFMIPPGNKFVDDGSRYMKQSSMEEREKNYKILLDLIKEICPEYFDKMVFLTPSDYYNNFITIKNYINELYQ